MIPFKIFVYMVISPEGIEDLNYNVGVANPSVIE